MKYILSEEEFNMGCQLREGWKECGMTVHEVYEKSESLIKQGYYVVIKHEKENVDLYQMTMYQKGR